MAGESTPLLTTAPVTMPEPVKEARGWRGAWWHLLGDGSPADVASCCLAWHAPPVAWGWNASRSHGLSWWREALKFLVLTAGVLCVIRGAFCLTMMAACGPMDGPGRMGPMPLDLQVTNDASSTSDNTATVAVATAAAATRPADEHHHGGWHHGHGAWEQGRDWNREGSGDAAWMGMSDMDAEHLQECVMTVAPIFAVLAVLATAVLALGIVLFTRRRTAMRERFGIAGTPREDCLLWTFCAPCALAQETRTLMHNNVEAGMWMGPHPMLQAPAAQQV